MYVRPEVVAVVKDIAVNVWHESKSWPFHNVDPWMRFMGVYEPWSWRIQW